MSITLTPVNSDNFTRSNENPLSQGGNWSGDTHGDPQLQLVSDLAEPTTATGTVNISLYTGGTALGNNQYAKFTLPSPFTPGFNAEFFEGIRTTDAGVTFQNNWPGYSFRAGFFFGGNMVQIILLSGSTTLVTVDTVASPSDVFTIAVLGSLIQVLQNNTVIEQVTNTTYTSGETGLGATASSSVSDVQFANVANGNTSAAGTYSINGNVSSGIFSSANYAAIQGVTITLSGSASGSTTTDSDGNYNFTGLSNGTYTMTPTLAGATFSPSSSTKTISSADVVAVNFAAQWAVSGNAGVAGATVSYSGSASGSVTADGSGNYSIPLQNGAYTITPSLAGYAFSPTSRSETVNQAAISGVNFTATQTTFSISGTITSGGNPLQNVAVACTGQSPTTTASNGTYSFSGLSNGAYTVTPSLSGYTFSPANQAETVSGSNITGVNFTGTAIPPPSHYSVPDCRDYATFPNTAVNVNGTLTYTGQTSSLLYWFNSLFQRLLGLPEDSRSSGVPTASGSYPQNSRKAGKFGPGE